ncbi:MAG: DUF2909 domain-containing protein [Alkalimonas sp.]|uniref:DUF2909 domain-containing protein n=1 Tax=Alkalimonas delamerensis TaxID=265981 RepID=A0ABT9GTQ1_9GAMM|nr:DUF2909 domain-containing protein [Alkalimonas delamerensis]MCC5852257.1 DUF2909 domain-containing protein [Alkalimonas sp.]MDP4530322.1 DUF2909 domain-containing protein [Alkalimonas delamerensis]
MWLNLAIIALLLFIVVNLFRALFTMLRSEPGTVRMSSFLGKRVFLSALVMLLILVALATGVLTPNPRPY